MKTKQNKTKQNKTKKNTGICFFTVHRQNKLLTEIIKYLGTEHVTALKCSYIKIEDFFHLIGLVKCQRDWFKNKENSGNQWVRKFMKKMETTIQILKKLWMYTHKDLTTLENQVKNNALKVHRSVAFEGSVSYSIWYLSLINGIMEGLLQVQIPNSHWILHFR